MLKEVNGDFLQLLRGFFYVAQTKNVTSAAFLMKRNQSTVSMQIKKLEELLGTSLFQRKGKGMVLSAAGERLYEKTLRLFDIVEDIQNNIGQSGPDFSGNISIACLNQINACYLPQFVSAFRKQHPAVTFNIYTGMTTMVQHLVSSGEVDFGVIADTGMLPDSFVFSKLFETSVDLITPANHNWPISERVTEEELLSLPYVGFSESCLVHRNLDNFFLRRNRPFVPVVRVPYYEQLINYVSIGQGAGVLERFIFEAQEYPAIKAYSLAHLMDKFVYGIVRKKNKYTSVHAEAFISMLMQGSSPPAR